MAKPRQRKDPRRKLVENIAYLMVPDPHHIKLLKQILWSYEEGDLMSIKLLVSELPPKLRGFIPTTIRTPPWQKLRKTKQSMVPNKNKYYYSKIKVF